MFVYWKQKNCLRAFVLIRHLRTFIRELTVTSQKLKLLNAVIEAVTEVHNYSLIDIVSHSFKDISVE